MELFNLLAKLTLDTTDFDKELDSAEKDLKAIDAPDPKLELDNDDFNSGLEESQGLADTFGTKVGGSFTELAGVIAGAGILAVITGIVNGLKEAINLTAETADNIDKGSKKLGISTKAYQEWDHALKQSGSGIESVKKGIVQFQRAIKAADPSTPFADAEDQVDGLADKTAGLSSDAYEALRDLGLLSRLQAGEFKNAEQMMNAALLKLAEFDASDDAQRNERGILTQKLFGKGGDELNAMLDEGVDGVKSLLTEASDLGLIMSEDEIKSAVKYGDTIANLNEELNAIKTAFVSDIIPVLTDAAEWLTGVLQLFNPRLREVSLSDTFADIDEATTKAGAKMDQTREKAIALVEKLSGMGDYFSLDEEGKKTWDKLAADFIAIEPDFEKYIDFENHKIKENTETIKANIREWSNRQKQRLLDENLAKKQEAIAQKFADAEYKYLEAEGKEAEATANRRIAVEGLNDALEDQIKWTEELYNDAVEQGNERDADRFKQQLEELKGRRLTDESTDEDIEKLQNYFTDDVYKYEAQKGQELVTLVNEYKRAKGEVDGLRESAKSMEEDAKKAQEDLERVQAAVAKRLKLTSEEATTQINLLDKAIDDLPKKVPISIVPEISPDLPWAPKAIGDPYIPYDNFPALLHRGERVLTATEARRGGGSVDLGALEDRVAAAIRAGMDGVTVNSFLNGRAVTEEVNRQNINDIKGRRFRT